MSQELLGRHPQGTNCLACVQRLGDEANCVFGRTSCSKQSPAIKLSWTLQT